MFINYHTRGSGGVANTTGESRGRGRPRDAQVRAAVLQAAAELALAGGAGAASIDAIAKRAAGEPHHRLQVVAVGGVDRS